MLQRDLIPTKESGTHDNSGSSRFDETWPSTEQTGSTKVESPFAANSSDQEGLGNWFYNKKEDGKSQSKSDEPKSTIAR